MEACLNRVERHDYLTGLDGWEMTSCAAGVAGIEECLPFLGLFDEFAFGIVLVDGDGELIYASRTAAIQMQPGRGLKLVDGMVRAADPADQATLAKVIEGARRGRRGYLSLGKAGGRLDAAVLPVRIGSQDVVALVLEKAARSNALGLYFFSRAHGLTRAEQAILSHLCEGVTVIEVARRVGSSVHTVRTHVRGILSKTGMTSLRSLVSRVGLLPPIGARFAIAHARDEALAPVCAKQAEVGFAGA